MKTSQYQTTKIYNITRSRSHNSGLVPLPACDDGQSETEFVRVHAPTQTETVIFEAANEGAPPEVPGHVLASDNYVYLSGVQTAPTPMEIEGIQVWAISGTYIYGLRRPTGLAAPFPTGKPPYETGSASDNTIPERYFRNDLIATDPGSRPRA